MRIRVFVSVGPMADQFADCTFVVGADVTPPRTGECPASQRRVDASGRGDLAGF